MPREPSRLSPSTLIARIDPIKVVLVLILAILAIGVWSVARERVVKPFDELLTERLCLTHGEEIGREVLGHERSNRFGLVNRSEGFCRFGEGQNGEAPITLAIEDTQPGPLYRGAKWLGVIVQLGLVSIFLRFTVDPVLDGYRFLRSRRR